MSSHVAESGSFSVLTSFRAREREGYLNWRREALSREFSAFETLENIARQTVLPFGSEVSAIQEAVIDIVVREDVLHIF